MQISEIIISPDYVFQGLRVGSKKKALQDLSMLAARLTGQSAHVIFDTLLERERLGSTGVGHAAAIPHGRFDSVETIVGIFAQFAEPVEWESIDGDPVDLVFLLLVPEAATADHLQALARVSALLREPDRSAKLRRAASREKLFEILSD